MRGQGLRSLRSRGLPGSSIPKYSSTGSVHEFQVSNYSTHRTKTTSEFPHHTQNAPSSKKNLSSHTIPRQAAITASHSSTTEVEDLNASPMAKLPPLSLLPLSSVLRGIFTSTVSSSPILLPPSLRLMSILANSHSPILNPDRNPLLRWALKHTFYAQFCAGENAAEVSRTVTSLKSWGCKGVMLCYAKEAELEESVEGEKADANAAEKEILPWKNGTMETVAITAPGDFVALK